MNERTQRNRKIHSTFSFICPNLKFINFSEEARPTEVTGTNQRLPTH